MSDKGTQVVTTPAHPTTARGVVGKAINLVAEQRAGMFIVATTALGIVYMFLDHISKVSGCP